MIAHVSTVSKRQPQAAPRMPAHPVSCPRNYLSSPRARTVAVSTLFAEATVVTFSCADCSVLASIKQQLGVQVRREEVQHQMLRQFKQSMAAPAWELDDYEW